MDFAESNNGKECMICHYRFFNGWFYFKILYEMVTMI